MLRVGAVPYLVAQPLIYSLDEAPGLQLSRDVPSALVRRLREGTLDVALASSVEYFRQPGYSFIPQLAIACDGEVLSVRVFLRKPMREIRSIALDPSSETAAALTKIWAAETLDRELVWEPLSLGQSPSETNADAFLLIGDEALREWHRGKWESIDLGAAWKQMTGLPFVFALWLVRPELELSSWHSTFQDAAARGLSLRRHLALQGSRESGIPFPLVNRYLLECCRYRLGDAEHRALEEFRMRASDLGLCESGEGAGVSS